MIAVMELLLGSKGSPARQIFRALHSEDARVKVMRALLESAPINREKGQEYDDLIDLFVEIKKRRNAYAHGLWQTHNSGRVFLSETSLDNTPILFLKQREIRKHELDHTLKKISEFVAKSLHILYPQTFGKDGKLLPSLKKPTKPQIAK